MFKGVTALILFFLFSIQCLAQIAPAEGSRLHYRIIGFRFPEDKEAKNYKVEIALGHFRSNDSFAKKIIKTATVNENKVIMEVPAFGSSYTWRVTSENTKTKGIKKGELHHFSTMMHQNIDTTKMRLNILQAAAPQYKDYYVGVDAGGILYDMQGRVVWYIPDTNGFNGNVANLEFTPQGTVTFLCRQGFEINYNAGLIWKSPKKAMFLPDTINGDLYHHEFKKLSNGHIMTLGMELISCRASTENGKPSIITYPQRRDDEPGVRLGKFGAIIEYDEQGNVVWSWKTSKYLLDADLAYFNPSDSDRKFDAHDNAFYFDEKNKCIYLGFRNINRIIKIDYPSGKVLQTYGEIFTPGATSIGAGILCNQHSIGRTGDGYLYYFNNNSCHMGVPPTIEMIEEPINGSTEFKRVWEYICPVDGAYRNFVKGGNVMELEDQSFFINMGTKYSKLLIVNRDKKVLWSGLPERFVMTDNKWVPNHTYRATIISRKELEKMIWAAQKTDK